VVERAVVAREEYFQLKLTLPDHAPADSQAAEIWTGLAAVASNSHLELAWPQDARVAEACRPLLGTTLTLVPGTTREVAEGVASELRSAPYVLAVDVEPQTWTIRRDALVEPAEQQIFFRLLLAAYLYDPQGIGAAYASFSITTMSTGSRSWISFGSFPRRLRCRRLKPPFTASLT
jgi:hypothetical protein